MRASFTKLVFLFSLMSCASEGPSVEPELFTAVSVDCSSRDQNDDDNCQGDDGACLLIEGLNGNRCVTWFDTCEGINTLSSLGDADLVASACDVGPTEDYDCEMGADGSCKESP
jgi:hypothetical protein